MLAAAAPLEPVYDLIESGRWPTPSNPRDKGKDMTDHDIWQLV